MAFSVVVLIMPELNTVSDGYLILVNYEHEYPYALDAQKVQFSKTRVRVGARV